MKHFNGASQQRKFFSDSKLALKVQSQLLVLQFTLIFLCNLSLEGQRKYVKECPSITNGGIQLKVVKSIFNVLNGRENRHRQTD